MPPVSFIYETREDAEGPSIFVRERVEGAPGGTEFGPIPRHAVESFIRARRERHDREMGRRGALKIISPQPKGLH